MNQNERIKAGLDLRYRLEKKSEMKPKQWIPPNMRICTWDEAQPMNEDGSLRQGIGFGDSVPHGYSIDSGRTTGLITWLRFDRHKDKPWIEMGFEESKPDEMLRDTSDDTIAWLPGQGFIITKKPRAALGEVGIRPSALIGLKRALEIADEHDIACLGFRDIIRAEIAKYE